MDKAEKNCFSDEELQAYLEKANSSLDIKAFEEHLSTCQKCFKELNSYSRLIKSLENTLQPTSEDNLSYKQLERLSKNFNVAETPNILSILDRWLFPLTLGFAVVIIFITIIGIKVYTKTIVNRSESIHPQQAVIDSNYYYLFFAPQGSALICVEEPKKVYGSSGYLQIDRSYVIPRMGKLIANFQENNSIEFTQEAHFKIEKSGVFLASGKVVCELRSLLPKSEFKIKTLHGEVIVGGTKFSVEVLANGTKVVLYKGKITLRTSKTETKLVDQGTLWLLPDGKIASNTDRENMPVVPISNKMIDSSNNNSLDGSSTPSLENSF